VVPKLWNQTIETHRREVREAILDTTAALVAEHGLLAVSMSRIAAETGIGRATLYKYFPDVAAILAAWHERQVGAHLAQLVEIRDRGGEPAQRLAAVLEAYALLSHVSREHHDRELVAVLHSQGQHLEPALRKVHELIRELLAEAVTAGAVRDDVSPAELADYCLHALGAAGGLRSMAAVRRLVRVTMAGLRPD
jgi:AcrR family transcriptional regulator